MTPAEREQLYSTIRNQYENCVVKLILEENKKKDRGYRMG